MSEFKDLKLSELVASSTNPRTEFEENSLKELAKSIDEHGVLQPIIVRKHPSISKKFEVVCGERRFRASTIAGTDTIPVSIRELNDDEVFEIQIIENLERKDVHPMDEAKAFQKMLDSGKYTLEDIAAKVAKNQTFVAQRLKLNDLIPELQEEFLKGEFGIGHAVLYSRLTIEKQSDVFSEATTGWNQGYGTLKEAKSDLENENEDLDEAIFDIKDGHLIPEVGACTACLKCSSANAVLFPEYEGNFCFDSKCFNLKTESAKILHVIKVLEEKPNIVLVAGWKDPSDRIAEFIKDNGKEILKQYDDYNTHGKEGEGIEAWHVEDANFVEIFLKVNSKTEILTNNSGANQNLLNEISNIKGRADRALELDREKIFKRVIDELIYNDDKNESLLIGEELKLSEKVALCHSLASYGDDEWIAEDFGVDRFEFRRKRLAIMTEKFTDQFLFKVLRRHLKSDLVSVGNLDYGKNENPGAYFNIVKDYFPNEVQLYIDEQNDVAAKRIERSDKRIAELQKEIADKTEMIEEVIENNTSTKVCSECNRTDVDFINQFGHPAIWHNDSLCIPCSTKQTDDSPIIKNENIKGDPAELKELLNQNVKTFEKISRKRFALNNSYFKFKYPEMPQTPSDVVAYFEQHQELPFDMDPETNPNWLYECIVEYQKRNGVYNSQFFTPPATAERISELAAEYFGKDEDTIVLDACCGFGMLSKPIKEKGFIVFGFDFDADVVEMYKTYVSAVNEVEVNDYKEYNNPHSVKWSNIVSNPPYEVKDATKFLNFIHENLDGSGALAILLLPKGFVNKERPKALVEVLEKFTVLHQEDMQEDFARTAIKAEIVVLEKN